MTRDDFVSQILASPRDHSLQLIYADWLDENGKPELAQQIRKGIDSEYEQFKRATAELLKDIEWGDTVVFNGHKACPRCGGLRGDGSDDPGHEDDCGLAYLLNIAKGAVPTCAFEGCTAPATQLAVGREYLGRPGHTTVAMYCQTHVDIVTAEGDPEYREDCPNCGCEFGVG